MPLTPDEIAEIRAFLASEITKVRIPELPPYTTYGELSMLDRSPIWMNGVNKTVWVDQLTLKALLTTGGSGSIEPVLTGDTIIHEVTAAEAGGNEIVIPEIAGKNFFLRLEGRPVKPSDFQILNAGGFKITIPDYELQEGQLFDLEVYELRATGGGPASLSSSFIAGIMPGVNVNTTLNALNDVNKLIQIRAGAVKIEITLPDIALVGENAVVILEATINNDFQNKIKTQAGQFIYFNNNAASTIYISPGEVIWLYKGADGWYDLNQFGKNYLSIGKPFATYGIGLGEFLCKGQLLNRADYPKLWEYVQTLGDSLVSDVVWNTPAVYRQGDNYYNAPPAGAYETIYRPYRGCYSTGDGATTFRIPDLMDMALRGILSEAGIDPDRYLNAPGGYMPDMVGPHSHGYSKPKQFSNSDTPGTPDYVTIENAQTDTTGTGIHAQTAMRNIGVMWAIKY